MNKVIFVGAGPGDPELITVKGKRMLEEADIVIYAGSLVNPELLDYCTEDCEIYNSAHMDLYEIIDVMRDGIESGKRVVRLHTGDMSIYGSIREQVEELSRLGIGYECVAGVSSFLGAASSLGIEYTVPEISQSLIITRLEGRTPVPAKEALSGLAAHSASMVIFLSVGMIDRVVDELLKSGGYNENTPIAVIYKATWPEEKIIRSTIGEISEEVRAVGINKTALIMVGDFLGSDYNNSKLYAPDFETEYREAKTKDRDAEI